MNTVFELMVEAMQAQTNLMTQVVKSMAPADYDVTIGVFSFDDEEDLEDGPLTEEEVAEWIEVPEGTDMDLVLDIVRQVEEIYGIGEEDDTEWEDDEDESEEEESEESEEDPIEL